MGVLKGLGLVRKHLMYEKSQMNSFVHLLFGSASPEMQNCEGWLCSLRTV